MKTGPVPQSSETSTGKVKKSHLKVTKADLRSQLERVNALASNWESRLGRYQVTRQASRVIRVASDCSGYGSDLVAYKLLGLQKKARPVMMSENDNNKVILYNAVAQACGFTSDAVATDMFLRKQEEMAQSDVYIAGYPCPSYSNLGKGEGVQDRRGLLTLKGLEYVALRRPKMLVLEQVKAILQKKHSQVWTYLLKILKQLDYVLDYKVCNTRDFGVPQSRQRVYLLAVAREICRDGHVAVPQPENRVDLHLFLRKDVLGSETLDLPKYEKLLGEKMWVKGYILDVGASPQFQSVISNCCPCLTKTRLGQQGYYIPKLRRRLLTSEAGALQGLPSKVLHAMEVAAAEKFLPAKTIDKSIGDAMSINVLATVVMAGLCQAGLINLKATQQGTDWSKVSNGEAAANLSDKLFSMSHSQ